MNKKLLLLGAVLATGFIISTAFDKKTLEQQKAEIAQMVTMKLDELRMQKEQECTDKINVEAQRRFDEIVAARAAEAAAKPGKKTTTKKGAKVDPLPQPKPGTGSPSKDKWSPDGTTSQPSKEKWTPTTPEGTKETKPSPSKEKWTKPSGGGN